MAGNKRRSARFVSLIIGIVVVLLSLLLSLFALNSSKGIPGVPRTVVTMKFADTGDITADADIREADFRVGRLNAVEYRGDGVGTIEAQFDDERPVYRNATAQIVSRSGLGQKYVNINRGTPDAGLLEQNGTIPLSQTQSTAEILSLTDIFDKKTTTSARSAIEQLGSGLEGNGDALSQAVDAVPTTLPRLQTIATAANNNGGRDLNMLLGSLRNLTSRFEGRQQQLTDLNRNLATTLDAVNADQGQALANLLQTAPPAFRDVRKALNDAQPTLETTTAALTNIRPGVQDLARATPDVRGVFREAPSPLNKIPGVSRVGQPALQALTPAVRDLRPVVPKLRFGLENARVPLKCLAEYSKDVGFAFSRLAVLFRQGDARGNTARFSVVPEATNVGGIGPPGIVPGGSVANLPCPSPWEDDHKGWGNQGGDNPQPAAYRQNGGN